MPLKPPDFDQWFAARAGKEPDGTRFALHQDTGWLWLPSGRLVAAAPISFPDPDKYAFVQTVSPGRYPVGLLIEEYPVRSGPGTGTPGATIEYVAAARLVVRDEPAATWEMAVRPGQDVSDLDDDSFFGYPVDGGMACFTDAQTLLSLDALEIPDTDDEDWADILSMDVSDSRASLAVLTDPSQNDAPIVVGFSTGGGDGRYPTWVGRTAQGDITCFATDFMLARAQPTQ
jgi:hypothetical protein